MTDPELTQTPAADRHGPARAKHVLAMAAWFRGRRSLLAAAQIATRILCWSLGRLWILLSDPVKALKWSAGIAGLVVLVPMIFWVCRQISHPPVIVERVVLPDPIKGEGWLAENLNQTIVDQIARIRDNVKVEWDLTFDTSTEPVSVTLKAEDVVFDLDKHLLYPLRLAFSRTPITVRTTLTCFHPQCLRVSDDSCGKPIIPTERTKDRFLNEKEVTEGRLCLRVVADIEGAGERQRVTTRLNLNNASYRREIENESRRIAEAVIAIADPAAASLHHFRKSGQEVVRAGPVMNSRGAATDATRAALHRNAESECWSKNLLARIALDEGDVRTADRHLKAADAISVGSQLLERRWPGRCYQHTQFVRSAYFRRVLRSDEKDDGLPVLPATNKEKEDAEKGLVAQARGFGFVDIPAEWREVVFGSTDQREAAAIILGEIYVRSQPRRSRTMAREEAATVAARCPVELPTGPVAKQDIHGIGPTAAAYVEKSIADWASGAAEGEDLAERAATRYVRVLGRIAGCEKRALMLAEQLVQARPRTGSAFELLGDNLTFEAIDTASGRRPGNPRKLLEEAALRYRQAIHATPDEGDMELLVKLASVQLALAPRVEGRLGQEELLALSLLQDAVRRFERALYPEHLWEIAYRALARWAGLVLVAYGQDSALSEEGKRHMSNVLAWMPLLGIEAKDKAGASGLISLDKIGGRIACIRKALMLPTSANEARRYAGLLHADETFRLDAQIEESGCVWEAKGSAAP